MSILLNYFKQLNNRKIVYTLYLLKLINPQIIIQADQEYLISKLKELNLNSDELETIKNTIDNFLINDEIVYGDGSLSYKIFCSLMFLKFYCPYTHIVKEIKNYHKST
ncbi:hypothetical protein H9W84_03210 [Moraxella sp. PS-22]|uniref:Uncharacterized protein n=1 Tax=Moraxella tetraodonis TaxID=2767221 RepID=A0A9X2A0X9_9GAMM|nr:hypothetical protein [Moraxella tetraodonis]MCG8147135.1 hypothetical protein [Moraxella tetraodonis]